LWNAVGIIDDCCAMILGFPANLTDVDEVASLFSLLAKL